MKLLSLDASTDWLSVAVGAGSAWHSATERAGQQHSQRMLPLVQKVLATAGWRLQDLDGIAFGSGPGSFTGVRIACGVAQGLALGADLPVVAVCTLEALAQAAWQAQHSDRVLAVLDARMQEVYAAAYQRASDASAVLWDAVSAPMVLAPVQLGAPAGAWTGVGDGFTRFPELAAQLGVKRVFAELHPTAEAIGILALPRLAAGDSVAARDAVPLYIRNRVALTAAERASGARL
jgi:tRNA threonylcarbamoyladenosine biosynthesis protein TsaB